MWRSSREAPSETKVKLIKEKPHTFSRYKENSSCPSNLREDSLMAGGNPGLPEGHSVAKSSHSLLMITSRMLGFRRRSLLFWLSGKNLSSPETLPLSASSDGLATERKRKAMCCFLSRSCSWTVWMNLRCDFHWCKQHPDSLLLADSGGHCGSGAY